jgi:hypothetical protein
MGDEKLGRKLFQIRGRNKEKIKGEPGNKETNLKTNVNKNNRIIEGT